MRVADQHRPGAEQVIYIFLAVLVPDTSALALADDHLGREIAKRAAGQYPLRLVDDFLPDPVLYIHDPVSLECGRAIARPCPSRTSDGRRFRRRICARNR